MRKLLWVLFAVGTLAGCEKEEAPKPARAVAGRADGATNRQAATEAALKALSDESTPYILTQEKLDAYVSYQQRMQEAYAATMKELQGGTVKLAGGTAAGSAASLAGSMKAIESKAQVEAEARREGGLTERDVNSIGAVVMDVITQRHMAAMLDLAGELQKLEAMQARLKPEQQKELAPQIETMRQRVREMDKLTSVRQTHGDANVDLVLTREQELMRNYQEMLRSFGGKAR